MSRCQTRVCYFSFWLVVGTNHAGHGGYYKFRSCSSLGMYLFEQSDRVLTQIWPEVTLAQNEYCLLTLHLR